MLTATDIAPRPLGGGRVLVVERGEESAACLTAMLRLNGFNAQSATTGEAAFRELASWKPRAMVLDLDLPGLNAGNAIPRLKKAAPACAIIVVTAHADAEHRRESLAAGAAAYLLKPADPGELVKLLQDLCPPD